MRKRTTWIRSEVMRLAADMAKKAEDPRAMNQDHLKQQPAADKYVIGDPSDFAEDVHPSNGTWEAEYSGGEVRRNEIGMAEMRGETFNHKEKTASDEDGEDEDEDDEFLEKKAEVCVHIARKMLPKTASDEMVEDQALAFMHLPDSALVETANRLAQDQESEDDEEGQSKEAQDQDNKKQSQGQEQEKKQGQGQDDKKQGQGQQQSKEAQDQDDKKQSQGQEQEKGQGQSKEAQDQMAMYSNQACLALQQGDATAAQQAIQQMVQLAQQQQQAQQQQRQQMSQQQQRQQMSQQQQMSQEQAMQQVQQMYQQALAQAQQQDPTLADEQFLDQMFQQDVLAASTAADGSMNIELAGASLDMGEKLSSEDEVLQSLFASNEEFRNASEAQALQSGGASVPAPMVRTASARTVGTRPTGGVSQIGGGSNGSLSGTGEIDRLQSLWATAPDVRDAFR